jgi:hypothetical protein
MQRQVDLMEVGPVFDATVHTAQILALLFFAMTYSTGLSLLPPAAFVSFSGFFLVSKVLLCRYYQKPPHIGEGAMRVVLACLPWAAVIRLAIGAWMLGNPDLFGPGVIQFRFKLTGIGYTFSWKSYVKDLSQLEYRWGGSDSSYSFLEARVYRAPVFPLVALIAIILIVKVAIFVSKRLRLGTLIRYISASCSRSCCRGGSSRYKYLANADGYVHPYDLMKLQDPLRQEAAPFTGSYYKYVKDKNEVPSWWLGLLLCRRSREDISTQEMIQGWELADMGDYIVKVKLWDQVTQFAGVTRARGDRKRTYELITDEGCNSYSIDKVPAYRLAIQGLKEGAAALMEYHAKSKSNTLGNVSAADMLVSVAQKDSLVDKYVELQAARKRKNDPMWNRTVDPTYPAGLTTDQKTQEAMQAFYKAGQLRENDPDDEDVKEDDEKEKEGDSSDDSDDDDSDDSSDTDSSESDEEKLV